MRITGTPRAAIRATPRVGAERAVPRPRAERTAGPDRTGPAIGGLLLVTAAWGTTFVLLDRATQRIPAADYLTVRFALAAVVLAAVRPRGLLRMPAGLLARAVVIGALFGVGNLLQTEGLSHTSASVSAFVTGMYVVFTPILAAVVLRRPLPGRVWAAVALATAGLGVMTLNLTGGPPLGRGEVITLLGAVLWAGQIVALGVWTDARYTVELAVVQAATTALVCGLVAVPGGVVLPSGRSEWLVMIYLAVVVGAVTMLLQTWAQAHLHPARAAIVMTFEPVWASLFAVLIGGEALGRRFVVGGIAVLGAMYLCERRTPAAASGGGRSTVRDLVRRVRRGSRRRMGGAAASGGRHDHELGVLRCAQGR